MNFDEFDAPQFVDFSKENFDASHEGDSWFSSDSSSADLRIDEISALEDVTLTTHFGDGVLGDQGEAPRASERSEVAY